MNIRFTKHLASAAVLSLAPVSMVLAQGMPVTPAPISSVNPPQAADSTKAAFDHALNAKENDWYFSWGYSRQQYAPSDIHVSQPSQGNDFTVHQATATDYPATPQQTLDSITSLDITTPQENVRVGKFMNPEKTFAVEFSVDHSKYNTDTNQVANVTGTVNHAPQNGPMTLDSHNFEYALHNGLNHVMVNAVWLTHLLGPVQQPGDLQLISRVGAGILLPHAENTVFGNNNQVGPKNENICCFSSNDWWQLNGWTAGVEIGMRYTVYKTIYLELTTKMAYGALHNVPVYQGSADQTIIMTEQVFSTGFLF